MKIAIDAMGGDDAPKAIIEGVNLAKQEFPDLEFLIFGDEDAIKKYLSDEKNVEIVATTEVIDFHDEPVRAIRRKKDSSMVRAVKAVKEGEADGVLSAGNTGALLAGGTLLIGRIKGIDRPALLSTLPTGDGRGFVMLDLGANAENTAKHLETFAVLGSYYAAQVAGVEKPRIALLSNGAEESKGSKMILEAHELIDNLADINFIGNIESRDILTGAADVVVADGFTGNAVLKAIEGTASLLMHKIRDGIMGGGLTTKIGGALVKGELGKLRDLMSTDSAGGAVLVGIKVPLVKAHGNSSPEAIASAIRQIQQIIASDMTSKLVKHFTVDEAE